MVIKCSRNNLNTLYARNRFSPLKVGVVLSRNQGNCQKFWEQSKGAACHSAALLVSRKEVDLNNLNSPSSIFMQTIAGSNGRALPIQHIHDDPADRRQYKTMLVTLAAGEVDCVGHPVHPWILELTAAFPQLDMEEARILFKKSGGKLSFKGLNIILRLYYEWKYQEIHVSGLSAYFIAD